ncbi:polyprenyl synthetase family protein [Campylobacter sp. JMF_07 ED4]|uniref:polyprenyl synthetase family protein n=1 Tax=unclassified Campylobacter TaxID=2593542 RepID=UPI0022E9BC46|nr:MULTISPECIES: polyprenyl synthetase family protein [unclassified Campylobacter]MDA3042672.1 polyprenyl synthetase family protein [Campylobacter sp. JMF_09 ED2]MDA3044514.1 polyprenyl synthetase family protein [Campylobacter sp. JMF_07 ED4]MDA3063363.1 polyprenyl synthetase family protein [Campylobacter sp. JMF_11 EL3]MDA3071491.1 polyprenyl synthetase family protein [Campylobacter sp. VBCF_03 NA9]
MDKIDQIMQNFIASCGYSVASEMFLTLSSGKKLRSKLLLNIAGQSEESLRLCAITELIQAASLLHDDVIDESVMRRGKPSINATQGSKNAVMLGDILYSKAYSELCKFPAFIATSLSSAVTKLAIGEMMDVKMSQNFNSDAQKYTQMIYYKTAVFIEEVARSAAYLKFGEGAEVEKFGEYGKNLGLAFQIIDDILDITQSSEVLGKPNLGDFKEGKTTLAYIYLYENLNENDKDKLKSLFKKELNEDEISWLRAKFSEHKIIERCINEAKFLGTSAIEAIKDFKNEKLIQIAENMINREF